MGRYDYQCQNNKCNHEQELIHTMKECDDKHPCPKCGADMGRVINGNVAIKPPVDAGWEYENGGKGRLFTQFGDPRYKGGDPRANRYFRSQNEAIEAAKREGYKVERAR
jgi:putative FmdB family regulatory protein